MSVGASLRSIDLEGIDNHSNCWVASEDRGNYRPPDMTTRHVLAVMDKLMRRGASPPLHPDSEGILLESLGMDRHLTRSPLPGDVSPTMRYPQRVDTTGLGVPAGAISEVDMDLVDTEDETGFVRWMSRHHPWAVRWLVPQAGLDEMLRSAGREGGGFRRCDFLWAPPGVQPFVIEIDGLQHRDQILVDAERDRLLRDIGVPTVRIPCREVRKGQGPGLDTVTQALTYLATDAIRRPAPTDDVWMRLAWGAIQVHRLVLGISRAIDRRFLQGSSWVLEVEDPTGLAVELLPGYMDTLHALDRLWGSGMIAPEQVLLHEGSDSRLLARTARGRYEWRDVSAAATASATARILLQCDRTPFAPLPAGDATPTVVVRSTGVPFLMSDPSGLDTRQPVVRIEGEGARNALKVLLRGVFAKRDFREGQYEAIMEVLAGRDCAVLLPTGAGKSLIYQMAGLCLPGRTLVIDPLVALIEDQVEGLHRYGIDRVEGITRETVGRGDGREVLQAVAEADVYFMLVAPERLQIRSFRKALEELVSTTPVNLAVVDEAHCVSEWGHDFRHSYLGLGGVLRTVCVQQEHDNPPPVLALTGTASRVVLRDVLYQLGIEQMTPNSIIRPETFDRPELDFRVVCADARYREARLRGQLRKLPARFGESQARFFTPGGHRTFSGLVFVPTVNGKPGLWDTTKRIREIVPSVGMFSGKPPKQVNRSTWPDEKRGHAQRFKKNEAVALVSTNAFGMGIDKPNIRWVVHYMLPSSIESYYQEVGRAGRDGRRAECVLILSEFDQARSRRLLAEDLSLESSRLHRKAIGRRQGDDVTTALYFHHQNFAGVKAELDSLDLVVAELMPSERETKEVDLPYRNKGRGKLERALHRLIILGVVTDYLVEFGSRKLTVTVARVSPDEVVQHLTSFVRRSQPGQIPDMQDRVGKPGNIVTAIERCGRELIAFIYRTIERSRRRSMREMLLSAHRAARSHNPSEELRSRILDYLTEGEASKVMLHLAEESSFRFADWTTEWVGIESEPDAREWHAAAARLLESYPDHPGLLASRALSEALIPDGEAREFESNIGTALGSARELYGTDERDMTSGVECILEKVRVHRPFWSAAVVGVSHYEAALPFSHFSDREPTIAIESWPVSVFALAEGLESALRLVDAVYPESTERNNSGR